MFAILFKNELAILRELRGNLWGNTGGIGRYHCIFFMGLYYFTIYFIYFILLLILLHIYHVNVYGSCPDE